MSRPDGMGTVPIPVAFSHGPVTVPTKRVEKRSGDCPQVRPEATLGDCPREGRRLPGLDSGRRLAECEVRYEPELDEELEPGMFGHW